MKILNHQGEVTDPTIEELASHLTDGTSLQGQVNVPYQLLVDVFGEPEKEYDTYKSDAEWIVLTPKGIATIYNYKNGKNYLGNNDGLATKDITEWHIGGKTKDIVQHILDALPITKS